MAEEGVDVGGGWTQLWDDNGAAYYYNGVDSVSPGGGSVGCATTDPPRPNLQTYEVPEGVVVEGEAHQPT